MPNCSCLRKPIALHMGESFPIARVVTSASLPNESTAIEGNLGTMHGGAGMADVDADVECEEVEADVDAVLESDVDDAVVEASLQSGTRRRQNKLGV